MFCNNCGTPISDGTYFCPNCGNPINSIPTNSQPFYPDSNMSFDNDSPLYKPRTLSPKLIVILLVLLGIIIVACIVLCFFNPFSKNNPKGVAEKYMKAMSTADTNAIHDLHTYSLHYSEDKSYSYAQLIDDELKNYSKITYKVNDYKKLDKKHLNFLKCMVLMYRTDDLNITEAGIVDCTYTVRNELKRTTRSETLYLVVVKLDKKWYLYYLDNSYPSFATLEL